MAKESTLQVSNLSVTLGGKAILKGINLNCYKGEILAVIGGSGSGKSVLMRSLLGLLSKAEGKVLFFGTDIDDKSDASRIRLRTQIGVLFQHGALFSTLTVLENIMAPMKELRLVPPELRNGLARLKLDMVGLAQSVADKYPSDLSGGMIKRVGIARALALDPKLVFLDEPTSGLDPISAQFVDEIIHQLGKNLGFSVFMITHDLDSLERVCDRIAVLGDGKMLTEGNMAQVKANDHPWIRSYFGVRSTVRTNLDLI